MSTRSGKRIHSSMHEDDIKADDEMTLKAERKTRSKRLKENDDQLEETHSKSKKRHNYVSYPADDDHIGDTLEKEGKTTRKTKRYTLKEQDINIPETENIDSNNVLNNEIKKNNRVTRQTKKLPENEEELTQNPENAVTAEPEVIPNGKVKGKKNKKKKSKHSDANENEIENVEIKTVVSKKSKKKKKGKKTNTPSEEIQANVLNRSNISTDSFHSAAGSPLTEHIIKIKENKKTPERKMLDTTFEKTDTVEPSGSNTVFEKKGTPRRKSSIKIAVPEKHDVSLNKSKDKNSTFDKMDVDEPSGSNSTFEKRSTPKRKSNIKIAVPEEHDVSLPTNKSKSKDANSTYEKIDSIEPSGSNTTFEKRTTLKRKSSIKIAVPEKDASLPVNTSKDANSTFDKAKENCSEKLNTTFEKDTIRRKSLRSNNSTVETINNSTFEKTSDKKQSKTISLDTTFDKSDLKPNTTFDKIESKSNSAKSSLISSDDTGNLTYDKDNSRISITSDESKTENIVNTTPVLIESSMDESNMSTLKQSIELETSKDKNVKEDSTKPEKVAAPVTPLKREGTFTKDSPEVMTKRSSNQTPTKRASLPYPGNTPFHVSRSSTKEKSILNVTRSIEKPTRRSSLAALAPRQTRVMFCSPVNNPAVVMQQRKKVIKSSLKGSNKSFVFDEKESSRPGVRKRSYTHNDAEDTRAKRTRLADDLQQSVDRLSRPRTSSAAAKLDNTPAKKQPTPAKPKSDTKRTKLPDFKTLHQKQFDKMESLDECQRRKARRARQLLTPTGGVEVLKRSLSPRVTTDTKADKKDPIKKMDTPTKAPTLQKLPTLESLRPGYTRFGFKMNSDVINPFSIPSKNDNKTKEKLEKPNGLHAKVLPPKTPNAVLPTLQDKPLQRQPTLPSLNGNTVTRKEVAKQAVMREKSFTSLSNKRDVKRSESRTIIKGVRTNRRFELQMKMRNID